MAVNHLRLTKIALAASVVLLGLIAVDIFSHYSGQGWSNFKVTGDSPVAMLFVGLAAGMALGVGGFFGLLLLKERQERLETDSVDQLLNEIAADEDRFLVDSDFSEFFQGRGDEEPRQLDPWEQPADWWKRDDN